MRHSSNATEEHFAGGRSLKWYVCAGSLMLTNLSTEQLVGLNGAVFQDGCLAGIWWEAGAALAMIVTATVFLPKYFALGLTTTTGFLGERYDLLLPTMVSVIFLLYYTLILCPLVLYTGALAIRDIFDLDLPLWVVSTAIGLLGAAYALFGGLTAVAVSDCLNGIGLLIAGLWVPIAALQVLPGGLISLFEEGSSYLQPLVATSMRLQPQTDGSLIRESGVPSVPWHVNLTGMFLNNMYYWSTDTVIVQRVLAAESLSHGQKGMLFAAIMKVVGFTLLCMPGIIGIMMVKGAVVVNGTVFKVDNPDEVYSRMVKALMPKWSLGFFCAVLLGSVLTTFNAALNSACTIFSLDIYQIYINREATDGRIVKISTIFGVLLALLSFVIAPQLARVGGIFNFLQHMNSIYSLPIVTVFFVGIVAALPDAFAAKVGFAVAVVTIVAGQFVPDLHYLDVYLICFLLAASAMVVVTYIPVVRRVLRQEPQPSPYECTKTGVVDMTPWRPMYPIVGAILVLLTILIISLQLASFWLFVTFWCLWFVALVCLLWGATTSTPMADAKSGAEEATVAPNVQRGESSADGVSDAE
mmetsp:Transcript_173331/g.550226  ORF Transcript_173331/g.550226 Transcript_173331/m.550226 type:complete len:582 (+) Transcript_173331:124-1869(+)